MERDLLFAPKISESREGRGGGEKEKGGTEGDSDFLLLLITAEGAIVVVEFL